MTRLLGISGSLRTGSFNTALLRAAQQVAEPGVQIEIATLHGIPLYDADLESASGIPEAVKKLKEQVIASDGVLLVTPEYNAGIPGVFKNGIDWMSRPASDIKRVFGGRPFALLGATPGGFGTAFAQNAWLPVLKRLGTQVWSGGQVTIARAPGLMDAHAFVDEATLKNLKEFVKGFAAFAARAHSPG